jgi:hypothetical protein
VPPLTVKMTASIGVVYANVRTASANSGGAAAVGTASVPMRRAQ